MEMEEFNKSKIHIMSQYQKYLEKQYEDCNLGRVCCICNNIITGKCLECQGCHCIMHNTCYNLKRHPDMVWYCIVCEDILRYCIDIKDYDVFKQEDADRIEPDIMQKREKIFCCICGYSEGAMFRTVLNGVYCHVACASWCEEVQLSNEKGLPNQSLFQKFYASPQGLIPQCNPLNLSTKRMEGTCSICHRQGGVVWCSHPDCTHCCHVLCGYRDGWKFQCSSLLKKSEHEGCPPFLSTNRKILCNEHFLCALSKLPGVLGATEAQDNPDKSNMGDECDLSRLSASPACQVTTSEEPDPSALLHYYDILSAKWSDLTCLSWTPSSFTVPPFLKNTPLMVAIREKVESRKEKRNRREVPKWITDLSRFDNALHSGVWKIDRKTIDLNALLNQQESNSSQKHFSYNSLKRSEASGSSPAKRVKVENKEHSKLKKSGNINVTKVNLMQYVPLHTQEAMLSSQQRLCLSPQIEQPNLSLTLKEPFDERAFKSKLDELISSQKFLSLFGKHPVKNVPSSDLSSQGYIFFYHRGMNKCVFERYTQRDSNLNDCLSAPNDNMIPLEQMLITLTTRCKSLSEMIFVLRCIFLSTFYSIFPPHLYSVRMSKEKSTYSRNLVNETNHLARICQTLFEITLEFNNLLSYYQDNEKYKQRRNSPQPCLQCICLCDPCDETLQLVCDSCHVGYHPECIGLQRTGYPEILQTKFYGCLDLRWGFLCPRCCAGNKYEISQIEKGSVQIKKKFLKSCKMLHFKTRNKIVNSK